MPVFGVFIIKPHCLYKAFFKADVAGKIRCNGLNFSVVVFFGALRGLSSYVGKWKELGAYYIQESIKGWTLDKFGDWRNIINLSLKSLVSGCICIC
jgi:hypothetical protein